MGAVSGRGDRLYLRSLWMALRRGGGGGRWDSPPEPEERPLFPRWVEGPSRCTGCWLCVAACPSDCLEVTTAVQEGVGARRLERMVLEGDRCLGCGYCVAACPVGALVMGPGDRPGASGRWELAGP